MKVKSESEVAQLCPTLRDLMDCSLPGSSVHGIFQARVLEWGAIAFSESPLSTSQTAQQPATPQFGIHGALGRGLGCPGGGHASGPSLPFPSSQHSDPSPCPAAQAQATGGEGLGQAPFLLHREAAHCLWRDWSLAGSQQHPRWHRRHGPTCRREGSPVPDGVDRPAGLCRQSEARAAAQDRRG